jgi:hypothetical protein
MIDWLIAVACNRTARTGLVPVKRMIHGSTEQRDRVPTGVKPVENNGCCTLAALSQSIDLPLA